MATVDITLLGATGFTGGLTADYLGANLPADATWAIAGRNEVKLRRVVDRISTAGGNTPSVVLADTAAAAAMASMAEGTRVLATTVGPYLQHGEAAVKAAAEAGIVYLDLTGEPEFVDHVWLTYDEVAKSTGATYHSALNAFSRLRDAARTGKERMASEPRPTDRTIRGGGKIGRGADGQGWGLPLPTIDPQIVLRSARALDRYGPDFRYEHFAHFKTRRMLVATIAGGGVLLAGSRLGPTRKALGRLLPQGEGPGPEKRASSWFKLRLEGEGGGKRVVTGQTTTAVAMGDLLIERLQKGGMRFEVLES
ncbi:MAG: saccharopine dehydrogenase NADP-binding domain-containing protein [Aeromicrobium sp.]